MNIKSYAFRLTIAVIGFVLGGLGSSRAARTGAFSSANWFGNAAATVKKVLTFQSQDEKDARGQNIEPKAFYNFTGEYFLSEEPTGFTDFSRLELETHSYDGAKMHADAL